MKNTLLLVGIFLAMICGTLIANGQSGTFTTIAGNGTNFTPNTSGPATASAITGLSWTGGGPMRIATDFSGSVYFGSYAEHIISRVNTDGTISRVIGDGNAMDGPDDTIYVNHVGWLMSMACDRLGNLYFTDEDPYVSVKKLSPEGVLSELAYGTGNSFVYTDTLNNVYYGDGSSIKQITPSGTVTTIVGTGISGYSGDGGPATAAQIQSPADMVIDAAGNIYILDIWNYRVRKINTSGIISTIAGNGIDLGTVGWSGVGVPGDGGPANLSSIYYSEKLTLDNAGNLILSSASVPRMINAAGVISSPDVFASKDALCTDKWGTIICDAQNLYIQKFNPDPTATSGHFSLHVSKSCSGANINILSTLNDTLKSINYYGDGTADTVFFNPGIFGTGTYANMLHSYSLPGAYTIKNFIIDDAGVVDSFTTTYINQPCEELLLRPYIDNNGNCHFDSLTDIAGSFAITAEVDSNGVAIDTISLTSGAYYTAYGNAGDIYSFRAISIPPGMVASCPSSGIITDTLSIYADNARILYLGFNCSSLPGFDIALQASHRAGRHTQQFQIAVKNDYCTPTTVTITANVSPKYNFHNASRIPTSVSGHTLTWVIPNISNATPVAPILLNLERPGLFTDWLMPGDTVHTTISTNPIAGDLDTSNNEAFFVDTVKSSFDPNYIAVTPEGNILAGTKLKYIIEFENDGNDTAQNIYVMDTLSDNVDPASIEMVMATHTMNIVKFTSGGHTILKFDFPNIKLLDSSHHNQCTGMLMYNINSKRGLPDNTDIFNHAGIFFDDNPVVMTNTIQNVVRMPAISIAQVATLCPGDTTHFIATTPNIANTRYKWFVNIGAMGADKTEFTSTTLNNGDIIKCELWDGTGDTLLSTSNDVFPTFLPLPNAGTITGIPAVCELATTTLTNISTGGAWSSSNAAATVTTGVVTGVTAGNAIISYSVTNMCGTAVDTMMVMISPLPNAGTITGASALCETTATTLTNAITGGSWTSSSSAATVAAGVITGVSAGSAIISYSVSNGCGTAVDTMTVTIYPLANAGAIIGSTSVCQFATTTLSNLITGGTWTSSSANATVTAGAVHGVSAGIAIISYSVSNSCNVAVDTMMVTVNPLPVVGAITGATSVCVGASTTLTNTVTGGFWSAGSTDATIVGGLVTGVAANNVDIYYFVSNSCGTAIDTMTITVLPLADAGTITGSSTLCVGNNTTLANVSTGGVWTSSTTGTGTINSSGMVTGLAAGTTTISYVVTNTCGADTTSTSITVNALPDAGIITGIDSVCEGMIVTLSNTATGIWSSSNNGIATVSATGEVTGVSTGIVAIVYTATNSCGSDTATFQVFVRPFSACEGGVENAGSNKNDLILYPNPNDGTFTISGSLPSTGSDVHIEIVNMLGQVVYKNIASHNNGRLNEVIQPGNKLADGTYLLRVNSGAVSSVFHFVIKS